MEQDLRAAIVRAHFFAADIPLIAGWLPHAPDRHCPICRHAAAIDSACEALADFMSPRPRSLIAQAASPRPLPIPTERVAPVQLGMFDLLAA